MAVLEIQLQNASSGHSLEGIAALDDGVLQALESLGKDDPMQLDFIQRCLKRDPAQRATARELLFHPILFEVHSLKLLAAHCLVHETGENVVSATQLIFFERFNLSTFFRSASKPKLSFFPCS
jgi:nuclear receptor-binding protein